MKAAIYIRVSSDEQVQGTSLDTQDAECRTWCARNGYEVERVFADRGETAKTSRRPEFLRLVAWCREAKPEVVVVWKFDRWARNSTDHHVYAAALAQSGTRVVSATEPTSDDPAGRLLTTLLAGIAQFDNEVRSERVRTAMRSLACRGAWLHGAPFGYRRVEIAGLPGLEPDPIKAPIIRDLFARVASGVLTPVGAVSYLRTIGYPHSRGSVHRLLRLPVYAGIVRTELTDGRDVPAVFDGLISLDTWSRVQAVLSGFDRRPQPVAEFPLRGLFVCSTCGRPIWASASRGRSGRMYPYYHCRDGHVRFSAHKVHAAWTSWLVTVSGIMVPAVMRLREALRDVAPEEMGLHRGEIEARRAVVTTLQARRQRMLDCLADGTLEPADYRRYIAETNERLDRVRGELAELEAREKATETAIDAAAMRLGDLAGVWGAIADDADRQAFVSSIFGGPLAYSGDSGFSNRASPSLYELCAANAAGGIEWRTNRDAARTMAEALMEVAA